MASPQRKSGFDVKRCREIVVSIVDFDFVVFLLVGIIFKM